ncbi:MAG: hypothetical protein J1E57_03220 [Prevotella sp.]|nr:hypothetical protein [Prevotella sp.]
MKNRRFSDRLFADRGTSAKNLFKRLFVDERSIIEAVNDELKNNTKTASLNQ